MFNVPNSLMAYKRGVLRGNLGARGGAGGGSPEKVDAVDWRLMKSCSQMLLCYFKWLHLVRGGVFYVKRLEID